MAIDAGKKAPAFSLKNQDGETVKLSDFKGQYVVVYFYPRDNTPGCTVEACSFRDEFDAIRTEGAVVLGVSTDDAASHRHFREQHGLPFPLLVDTDAEVATAYGAWGEKTLYGRKSIGMTRSTFVIGADGRLLKVWKRAKAADHGVAVLKALREARAR